MQSDTELAFNRMVADVLLAEYQRETGIALKEVSSRVDFPDITCETAEGRKVEIELVEVGLFFIGQENQGLREYERKFAAALSRHRPAFKGVMLRLQMSHDAASAPRPHLFPHIKKQEAAQIVAEFEEFVVQNRERLLTTYACLLRDLTSSTGAPAYPTLLAHFDGIVLNPILDSYPGRLDPDDPVIDLCSVTQFNGDHISEVIRNAFQKKDKAASYTADLLVLHTMKAGHKPHYPGFGMHEADIVRAGISQLPALKERFGGVWFLNAYIRDGKRLYRIK